MNRTVVFSNPMAVPDQSNLDGQGVGAIENGGMQLRTEDVESHRVCASAALLGLLGLGHVQAANGQDPLEIVLEPVGTIGVESGHASQEFGAIDGIAVDDRRGVLFLVDHLNSRLSAFRRGGQFISATGRAGDGPGEFRHAGAVTSEGSTIHVLDGNLQISTFVLHDDSLALTREVRLPFNVVDLCLLNGHLYGLGYHGGRLIHRFNNDGTLAASFGEPFRNDDPVMAAMTSVGGLIRCDHASQSVFVTAVSFPTVRRYSSAGQLLWESPVPNMVSSIITRTPSGVRFSTPPDREASDAMLSLVPIPGGFLVAQYGAWLRGMRAPEDIVDARSVVFDIDDGAVVQNSDDLPRLDFASGSYAYSRANDPFPRIVVYRWR